LEGAQQHLKFEMESPEFKNGEISLKLLGERSQLDEREIT